MVTPFTQEVDTTPQEAHAPGPLSLLREAWERMRVVAGRLLLAIVLGQAVMTFIAFPFIRWVMKEALRANGMYAIDLGSFAIGNGFPLTVALLIAIGFVVVWLLVLQFSIYMLLLHNPQLTWRELWGEVRRIGRKVFSLKSGFLAFYLLVVLPLSGFGFTSVVISGVAIPDFVTGELQKETSTRVLLAAALLLIVYLSVRWSLTLPIFVFSDENGSQSMASSWRLTRGWRPWTIVTAIVVIMVGLIALVVGLFYVMLAPTWLADQWWPSASPAVAAVSFGVADVLFMIVSGLGGVLLAGVLIGYTMGQSDMIAPSAPSTPHRLSGRPMAVSVALIVAASVGLAAAAVPTMSAVAAYPDSTIIAHRGFTEGGVENTIEALEAANAAGAEIVEFDTMQTKDGKFVVMHDTNLKRLTGENLNVKDLTLDELTAMSVHANGMTGTIPSLVEYVQRANELGQQLLIELKISGAETDTFVQDFIDELEDNHLLSNHIFHTLNYDAANQLKRLRPDLTVGYIMPFAGVGIPDTLADFLVVEENSATPAMQQRVNAAGLGYVVWTPNTKESINLYLRQGVDAIITDHPDWAVESRGRMDEEIGLAGRLQDMMTAFLLPV